VISYSTRFRAIATDTGYNEEAKMSAFKSGLSDQIRDIMATLLIDPDNLEDLISRLFDRKMESSESPRPAAAVSSTTKAQRTDGFVSAGLGMSTGTTDSMAKTIVVDALIDSGASSNFLDTQIVERFKISAIRSSGSFTVADGSISSSSAILNDVEITSLDSQGASSTVTSAFAIMKLNFDFILGLPWFQLMKPSIDWTSKTFTFPVSPPS
jgi:hypothetical protein